ncbi:MAG: hypothetical protein JSS75_12845 [Bacteroidetes bacterium]|nr:hypothetical protein [Bacteroidota bacterium]
MVAIRTRSFYALLAMAVIAGLSCQLPTQPGTNTVPVKLRLLVRDSSGIAMPGAHIALYRAADSSLVVPNTIDDAASTSFYSLTVPILGERYFAVAEPPVSTALTKYSPAHDTIRFVMPCTDHSETFVFERRDSIPCGTTTFERTVDLGTICVDKDTALTFTAGDFTHGCSPSASIVSITSPTIAGLTITPFFRSPETPITNFPATWASARPLAVRIAFTSILHQPVTFDGNDIVIDASPSVKITIHLKGKGIVCDNCDCPSYDSVSFGLDKSGKDTNAADIGDPTKTTTIDLSAINNSNDAGCDVLFTRIKNFSNPQLNLRSFSGSSGGGSVTLSSHASLGSMVVDFTAQTRGEFVDTAFYKVQKRSQSGAITDCDTLPVIYHGKVGQGLCSIDTPSTNSSTDSYLKNDTITNCVGEDKNSRYICIKNTGDGKLHFTFTYAQNDPQFEIHYDPTGIVYRGEDVVIPVGGSQCFTLHFIPDAGKVFATTPPTTIFKNSIDPCSITLPVVGQALPQCIHCLDGAISQYAITTTSYGGFIFQANDQFTFNSDPNVTPDIYASNVGATSLTLVSNSGTQFQKVQSNYTPSKPGIKFCDDPVPPAAQTLCTSGGGSSTITANVHDLILFKSSAGRCGLIYIDNIYQSNGIWVAVFQASYPIN